jgi:tetratricopeptide (TPR) repeat protein
VRARKLAGGNDWQLVHPRCARDRQLDIEEVRKMLAAGEVDVALDECRWLLTGCTDCIDVHRLLGEIAMAHGDLPLARGHFGYAYRLGAQALQRAGSSGPLPYRLPANQGFLESAKGLAWCLKQLGKPEMAAEVIELALQCDPNDPLAINGMLADGSSGGAPSLPVID